MKDVVLIETLLREIRHSMDSMDVLCSKGHPEVIVGFKIGNPRLLRQILSEKGLKEEFTFHRSSSDIHEGAFSVHLLRKEVSFNFLPERALALVKELEKKTFWLFLYDLYVEGKDFYLVVALERGDRKSANYLISKGFVYREDLTEKSRSLLAYYSEKTI